MTDRRIEQLFAEATAKNWDRRQVMKRAAALGISVPAFVAAMMQAGPAFAQDATPGATPVGTPAGTPGATPVARTFDTSNPLGVDPAIPVNPFIFNGGLGIAYAENVNSIYSQAYPGVEINFETGQQLGAALQPRFVGGNPPDVIDNSGDGLLDQATLASEGSLADLADLLAAPAFDTPGATVLDTLVPNSQQAGIYNGVQNVMFLTYTVHGLWASNRTMTEQGITYPRTWDEMLTLCGQIQNEIGIAPWVTTGVHTQYMRGFVFDQLVFKNGGLEAMGQIDNLREGAWQQESVIAAADAVAKLATGGYILSGWEGLDHTQSQTEWFNGRGVFLPCGSWLENESGESSLGSADAVAAFEMTCNPVPSLSSSDALPFEAIFAAAGENFIVPADANNLAGGKEWLRMLLSFTSGEYFSTQTRTLSVVNGADANVEAGPGFASQRALVAAAGQNQFRTYYTTWYKDMLDESKNLMFQLMTGAVDAQGFCDGMQAVADTVASDDFITKYTRPDYEG